MNPECRMGNDFKHWLRHHRNFIILEMVIWTVPGIYVYSRIFVYIISCFTMLLVYCCVNQTKIWNKMLCLNSWAHGITYLTACLVRGAICSITLPSPTLVAPFHHSAILYLFWRITLFQPKPLHVRLCHLYSWNLKNS